SSWPPAGARVIAWLDGAFGCGRTAPVAGPCCLVPGGRGIRGCDGQSRRGAGLVSVGRAAPDAGDVPALRGRCGPALYRGEPGTGVAVRPGPAAAGGDLGGG